MSIQISRQDIVSDYLFDYVQEDRYLKLQVEPYMELLGIEPLPSQVAIINAIFDVLIVLYNGFSKYACHISNAKFCLFYFLLLIDFFFFSLIDLE